MMSPEHARSLLSSTISQGIQRALHDHHARAEVLADQSVRDGVTTGFIDIAGEGECLVEVSFPLVFLERPIFHVGLELPGNMSLSWGSFPRWSATVGSWITRPAGNDLLYVGAQIAVVVTNVARSVLHYTFSARSYTPPTGGAVTVGSPL